MMIILGLAALVALTSCEAAIERSVEKRDSPDKHWTEWPPWETTADREHTTFEWEQTTTDDGYTTWAPGGPLYWRVVPNNQTESVGSIVRFDCSAYTYYHDYWQAHIVWLRQDDNGTYTLFYDDERRDAPYRMDVSLYWSNYYYKGSTLSIYGVDEADYGKYTCHIFAENGHNELQEDVHLWEPLPSKSVCQPGWSLHKDYCYAKIKHPGVPTWREANSYCRTIGVNSTLTSIHDYEENRFLDGLLTYSEEVWIGYYYHQHYRGYYWNDGTYSWYENWDYPYPNYDEDEGCVLMNYWGAWIHVPCDGGNKTIDTFICKAPAYEYVLAEPDNGCPWNWVGYREDCYFVDPDSYNLCHNLHYYASPVNIQSPDENDLLVNLIKENSAHQAQGTIRLSAYHVFDQGWKWFGGYPDEDYFYFKNWDANDILDMATNADGIDFDMETGVWRSHTASGVGMGTMCKLPKWASRLEKEGEKRKEGEKKKDEKEPEWEKRKDEEPEREKKSEWEKKV